MHIVYVAGTLQPSGILRAVYALRPTHKGVERCPPSATTVGTSIPPRSSARLTSEANDSNNASSSDNLNNNYALPMSLLHPSLRRLMFCDALPLKPGQKSLLVIPKESKFLCLWHSFPFVSWSEALCLIFYGEKAVSIRIMTMQWTHLRMMLSISMT